MFNNRIVALVAVAALLMIMPIVMSQINLTSPPFEGKMAGYLESSHSSGGGSISSATSEPLPNNIMLRAEENGNLKNFIDIVEAGDRKDALMNYPGPYTIFAPSDEAFDRLSVAEMDSIIEKDNSNDILEYLIVLGNYTMDDLETIESLTNIRGDILSIDSSNGIKVDDANIVSGDIKCSNGIIHIIDSVLRPSSGQSEEDSIGRMDDATSMIEQRAPNDPWLNPEMGNTST